MLAPQGLSIASITQSVVPHARAGQKKYYPEGGDFFRPAREALAGGKKGALAFSASGTAFPPTHSQLPGDTVLMQEPKEEHWNRGLTEQGGE